MGDEIEAAGIRGVVVAIHPATLELLVDDETVHLPNSRVFGGELRVRREI
ncbi:MAG: hypothetical protein GWN79_09025 [Actinobacteria bacterium]|nr:hypothetical protein [Actinomycetota bacterium]NIS31170.1 hypothetical protein [Actinomycetota bacterium]NIT95518.1 hypothetical protein [Actinomycetota bacterium]NIU19213.1 hypothetical protein [Actinomycetota bacterium]NIU66315.1 hypothetical protein [Actinomycetota bacterium]